jgi:branched-chain amino acid transport system permease protein
VLALRTRGAHFIMLTLAFGQMAYFTLMSLREFGGDDGLTITGSSVFSGGLDLGSRPVLYFASLGALALASLGFVRIKGSRFGLVLAAANQSEQRVEASGFSVDRYRLAAFVLAAAVCGLAGFLNANLTSFVTPDLTSWKLSAALMFMVVLGGSGTACGPVLGAAAFVLIEQLLGSKTAYWEFWFGAFLIVAVSGGRRGLASLLLGTKGGSA